MPQALKKEYQFKVAKAVDEIGVVFGVGFESTVNGKPYKDLQGHHIPPVEMLKGTTNFMLKSRKADDRHDEIQQGEIVHSLPLTKEIAKALEIQSDREAWFIGMKPSAEVFELFKSGDRTGFSIGGQAVEVEE